MPLGISGTSFANQSYALNAFRINSLLMQQNLAQLSSGQRIVSAGIDPSGLAISQLMRSQIGGTEQAIYNAQDTINLQRTAEATLSSQTAVLGRMRDLSVRAANEATMTTADRSRLNQEFQSLNQELTRMGEANTFNTKQLTSAVTPYGTQAAQVGPDTGAENQIDVTINPSTAATLGTAGEDISTVAGAQNAISAIDTALQTVSTQRANLGINENRFTYAVDELSMARINLAAARSRISDLNMAAAITERVRLSILGNTSLAALTQANAQTTGISNLLGI
ncbi:MAG: flagellin [bacterium]